MNGAARLCPSTSVWALKTLGLTRRYDAMEADVLLALVLSVLQSEQVVVRAVEADAAAPWTEAFSARCGQSQVEIRRPMRPEGGPVRILIDGEPAQGDLSRLQADLSEIRAAYRFSFQCSPDGDALLLRWVRGLADVRGEVRFRSGGAEFRDGSIAATQSEDSNAETFWYR